jgi:hypothetical protein
LERWCGNTSVSNTVSRLVGPRGELIAAGPKAGGNVASIDDATVRASFIGISRNGFLGFEMKVALDGETEFAADGGQFDEADVAEFRLAHPEIAEAEGKVADGVEFRQEPGALSVGGEELDDGFEVDRRFVFVDGGALRAAVGEELFGKCFGDECHVRRSLCVGGPEWSGHRNPGPRRVRTRNE